MLAITDNQGQSSVMTKFIISRSLLIKSTINKATSDIYWTVLTLNSEASNSNKHYRNYYPIKKVARLPKKRLTGATIAHEQMRIIRAEKGIRKGAGRCNHAPRSYPTHVKK